MTSDLTGTTGLGDGGVLNSCPQCLTENMGLVAGLL